MADYTYDQGITLDRWLTGLPSVLQANNLDYSVDAPSLDKLIANPVNYGSMSLEQLLQQSSRNFNGQTPMQILQQMTAIDPTTGRPVQITDPANQRNFILPDPQAGSLMPSGNDLGGFMLALAPLAAMVGGAAGVGGLSNAGFGAAEAALAGGLDPALAAGAMGGEVTGGLTLADTLGGLGSSAWGVNPSMSWQDAFSGLEQAGSQGVDFSLGASPSGELGMNSLFENSASNLPTGGGGGGGGGGSSPSSTSGTGFGSPESLVDAVTNAVQSGNTSVLDRIWEFLKTPGGMSVAGSLLSSIIGAGGAYFASKAQQESAREGMDTIWNMYQQNRSDLAPWREAGVGALSTLRDLTTPGKQLDTAMLDPGYGFGLSEGLKAGDARLRAMGMADSGAAVKAATRFGNDYATQGFNNVYNRLSNLAGLGQVGTTAGIAAGSNAANNVAGLQTQAGNARASGYMGGANAIAGGIGQGLNLYNQLAILDTLRGR